MLGLYQEKKKTNLHLGNVRNVCVWGKTALERFVLG